ncbi:MAG: CBS domain-containing protein [Rhizobiales bacterium]|nr:CBS domain-containing protein [Hyphomicrobiales bacterium]
MSKTPEARSSLLTPLVSLRGIVLDTETTGLDARAARVVQVGAVTVVGERIERTLAFDRLVDPGVPIPPASTAIHGIGDADVVGAASFGELWPELTAFIGDGVIVGHTIDFDLGVLEREAQLAGVNWSGLGALDIRRLAQIANPSLANYSLDGLCRWLEVTIEGRHTALGDAMATAEVYVRLLPMLRQRGIRTLAELHLALHALADRTAKQEGALAAVGPTLAGRDEVPAPAARVDSYPYIHRVADVMSSPPLTAPDSMTLREGMRLLVKRGASSVFVMDEAGVAGIVTERDVLRAIDADGPAALERPLGELRKLPLQVVRSDAFIYRAIGRMDRLGIRHLGVVDATGALVGAVTTRNLLRHRSTTAMMIGDETVLAKSEAELGNAWAKVPAMAARLVEEGVEPRTIAAVISSEICILTRRAAQIAEERMREAGRGGPPVAYAVLVLGSAGRGESLLAADQDNAIVYASGDAGGPEDHWFEELGRHMTDILDAIGVPFCKGGVMARNAQWRRSVGAWKEVVDGWVTRQRPDDLLNVDIFFDMRPVHGDSRLAHEVWAYAYERASKVPSFWRALSHVLGNWRSVLGMFGSIRTDQNGRVDLKMGGLLPIVTAARILSLKTGVMALATPDRLRAAVEKGIASGDQIEEIIAAHSTILGATLGQQLVDGQAGKPLGPRIEVKRLSRPARDDLKDALTSIPGAVDLAREGML